MKKIALLILLLIPLAAAQPLDWFKAERVTTQINISSTIQIEKASPDAVIQRLQADLLFVPKNSETTAIRKFDTKPPAIVTDEKARFTWQNPQESVSFRYSAIVEKINSHPKVTAKIPYPANFPPELQKYTQPTEHVDSEDPKVIGQAAYLAQEEDDLFVLASKMAMWSKNNIEYNMSTLTAEISQPASWVLQNRKGVCDEITTLFIAMLRSLGIPSKFVSGIAFTSSSQFPQGWGAHGWAEVYFPGTGWVPFDPTFGEFGWVDPGHIKLKESISPKEPTTVYEWKARNVEVKVNKLKISAAKIASEGEVETPLRITVEPLRDRVGFGSYNGVMANVQNLADYYVASELALAKVKDMSIINEEHQQAVLPPNSKRRIFWKVKVNENLDAKYQYEIPLKVFTVKNETAESRFHVGKWDLVFSKRDIENQIEREAIVLEEPFDLACQPKKDKTYETSTIITCEIENRKKEEQAVKICQAEDCKILNLKPGQGLPATFEFELPSPGKHEAKITASTDSYERKAILNIVRLDDAKVTIENIQSPAKINYGQQFQLNFQVSRKSIATPKKVTVEVKAPGVQSQVAIGDLNTNQEVTINVNSKQLFSASTEFDITAKYQDRKKHETTEQVRVQVNGIPWWKRAIGFFMNLF